MKKIKQSSSKSTNHNNIYFFISEGIALKRVKKLAQFFQVSITIRSHNFCPVPKIFWQFIKDYYTKEYS